ncbi:MAG: hypothetical protein K2O95_02710 [Clostridia bacterium]|nr:hypothetical protein [Clostridia bacterium]
MNTVRYKKEDIDQALMLLKDFENNVDIPSKSYSEIVALLDEALVDSEKLSKLLSKNYTVLAKEDDDVVGLASMDSEGNVGLLVARDGSDFTKTIKSLVRALERNATKKGLPCLQAWKLDSSQELLTKCGFVLEKLIDEEEGEQGLFMIKKLKIEEKIDLSPDRVKQFTLNPNKPIKVEGKTSIFPIVFFTMACFFTALLIAISVSSYKNSPDGKLGSNFTMFFVIIGILFAVSLAILIAYIVRGKRLKKEVLSMQVTNGVITDVIRNERIEYDKDRRQRTKYTEITLIYIFYDDEMIKRTGKFYHKYNGKNSDFFPGQEIVVAFSSGKCYLLKKYTLR